MRSQLAVGESWKQRDSQEMEQTPDLNFIHNSQLRKRLAEGS